MKPYIRMPLALAALGLAGLVAAGALVIGSWFYLKPGLPDAHELKDVRLQVPLSIYSRDGRLIAQMGEQRRDPVALADMPPQLVQAFLAAEDERFYQHPGFDHRGIGRAALALIATGSISAGGGSTITQQLARNFFLSPEQTMVRKVRELFLAVRIEKELTKDEILELYLNKIFLGQRAYGVSAASRVYFGKPLQQLEVAEMATIAGLPKAPSLDNPVRSPQRAEQRRAYVLRRMLETGAIDRAEHDAARAWPVLSRLHGPRIELDAPYVAEMVRSEMLNRYGPEVYESGFRVTTTLDSRLQRAANRALQQGLLEYDRRHGWRGPLARYDASALDEVPEAIDAEQHWRQLLLDYPEPAVLRVGLVLSTGERDAEVYLRERGRVTVPWSGLSWARRHINVNARGPSPQNAADVVQRGDVVYLAPLEDGQWTLTQLPQVQGALVSLDPLDGAVSSMAGGFDYYVSKFNRVAQARRQPGSSFKPFVFSAALEHGYTASSIVNDAPLVFESSELEQAWRPENYSRQWNGPTRLREALVRSLNLVSVRVLLGAGLDNTIAHLERFGFSDAALPRNPTLALGAGGATPLEMTAGYAVFANGGHRIEPYLLERVEDSAGTVVYQASPPLVRCPNCEDPTATPRDYPDVAFNELMTVPDNGRRIPAPVRASNGFDPDAMLAALEPDGTLEHRPGPPRYAERIVSPQNAWIVSDMMADVIRRGTGRRAHNELGRNDLAGKTGTSNDRRDAWFAGYNAGLVATAWVGFDHERTLGISEEGGRTALPMWIYFMHEALRGTPEHRLERPPGLVEVRISPTTGRVASTEASGSIFEIFEAGRVPPGERTEREGRSDRREDFDESSIF